jgi:hypothetical protein
VFDPWKNHVRSTGSDNGGSRWIKAIPPESPLWYPGRKALDPCRSWGAARPYRLHPAPGARLAWPHRALGPDIPARPSRTMGPRGSYALRGSRWTSRAARYWIHRRRGNVMLGPYLRDGGRALWRHGRCEPRSERMTHRCRRGPAAGSVGPAQAQTGDITMQLRPGDGDTVQQRHGSRAARQRRCTKRGATRESR